MHNKTIKNKNMYKILIVSLFAVFIFMIWFTLVLANKNNNITKESLIVKQNNEDTIKLTDIAPYYQRPTLNVVEELNTLEAEYVSFIVTTDTHGTSNKNNSQNIIRYLLKNTTANKVFHLGDSVKSSWDKSEHLMYFEPLSNCLPQVFYTLGNHETYGSTAEDLSIIYDNLLSNKEYLQGFPEKFYYFFDDVDNQIRYLFINTSDNSEEQVNWITEAVKLPTNSWKLIVLGHMDIKPNDPITADWVAPNAKKFSEAIAATNGIIIGYFCGHEHCDLIQTIDNKFYEVILLNDSCSKDTTFSSITNPNRLVDTISEQAISIVSINTKTGDVYIRRIGAGENLTYNYLSTYGLLLN